MEKEKEVAGNYETLIVSQAIHVEKNVFCLCMLALVDVDSNVPYMHVCVYIYIYMYILYVDRQS